MQSRVILSLGVLLCCFLFSIECYGEDAQVCLGCHGDKEIMKTIGGERAHYLHVDQARLQGSVHGSLGCTACHQDVSMEDHLTKGPKSGRKYSNTCKNCHAVFKGIHAVLIKGNTGNPACTDCHTAHAVKSLKSLNVTRESDYCLNCHGKAITLALADGAKLSLQVDQTHIDRSVHSMLSCSDCHFGFSSGAHATRNFKSRKDYTAVSSATCRRCHFKEYTESLESVHGRVTAVPGGGVSAGAVCTDCHGTHAISAALDLRAANPAICAKCHQATNDAFAKSVHGAARIRGKNQDAATCLNCHGAHSISDPQSAAFHLRVPEMCGKCHADEKRIGKYGISTTVVKTYKQDFHGITLGFFKQKSGTRHPAVCTDCHGIHTIAGMDQPNSPRDKAYLEQKCRMCHPDAPPGFSESSVPHSQASFAAAPTVFAINLFYKAFIGLMVVGLFVQILLHIRRIILNHNEENNHGK